MWPFTKKQVLHSAPTTDTNTQLNALLKSISLPQTVPVWKMRATSDKWDTGVAIDEGYNASTMVYACVEKNAKLTAAIPWKAQRKNNGGWEDAPESPLQKLIDKPNQDQSMKELMYYVSQALDLSGNAYFSEIKAGIDGYPVELWLLSSNGMKVSRGSTRLVDYYQLPHELGGKKIESDDMVHLRLPNPSDQVFGQPTLLAAGKATDIDREAGDFQKVSYQNRGLSDIHIELPQGATSEQAEAVRESYKKKQAGPKNAREPIVSSGKVNVLNQTAAEMDFTNSRRAVWIEICAAFGQSLSVHGMTENVNLANGREQNKQLYENSILPRMDLIQDQLNRQLASEFGSEWRMVYDVSNIAALQEGIETKLANAEKLANFGVPFDVINERLELGFDTADFEGSDIGYLPMGKVPVGMANTDLTPEEEEKAILLAYGDINHG